MPVNAMETVVTLYCLGNKHKEKSLSMFSTDATFFLNIFDPWLVEFSGAECMDPEGY